MAKQMAGILGGYSGKVGPVVGYVWNGKPCVRACPQWVKNPRTAAQMEHRKMFKQEVQLAAKMSWAVGTTLRDEARANGMTAYNLFVKLNQHAFGMEEERLTVDYSSLILSVGNVATVSVKSMEWTSDNVLDVRYERGAGNSFDHVYLYAYIPDLEQGFLAAPAYRRDKRVALALPDYYAGHTAHVYLMVQTADGRWGNSIYAGEIALDERVEEPQEDFAESISTPTNGTEFVPQGRTKAGSNEALRKEGPPPKRPAET